MQAPKLKFSMSMLYRLTENDRDEYMHKYFEMRYKDYLIQEYSRYGQREAAQKDIIESFNARNVQFEEHIRQILVDIGLPLPQAEAVNEPEANKSIENQPKIPI